MERLQQILVDCGFDIGRSGKNKDGVDGVIGRMTRGATRTWIKDLVESKNMRWCHNNLYELRMSDKITDKFSDLCIVVSSDEVVSVIPWTTKPGKYYINNPLTVGGVFGTGIQKEGQTIDSHQFVSGGKSKWGNVGYFKQIKSIPVYRDGNRDNKVDKNIVQVAPSWYGFFKHAMGRGFRIWNWSAGCTGAAKLIWKYHVAPFFKDGDKMSGTIIDV